MSVTPAAGRQVPDEPYVECCLRCSTAMEWRHQTWQCPGCGLKLGCCEGDTAECAAPERHRD